MDAIRATAFGLSITVTAVAVRCGQSEPLFDPRHTAPYQPPRWVFAVAWPVLYLLTGAAWARTEHTALLDALFAALTVLCCIWLPLYARARYYVASTAVLLLSAATAASIVAVATSMWRWLVAPLVGWLCFATYLNSYRALRG